MKTEQKLQLNELQSAYKDIIIKSDKYLLDKSPGSVNKENSKTNSSSKNNLLSGISNNSSHNSRYRATKPASKLEETF